MVTIRYKQILTTHLSRTFPDSSYGHQPSMPRSPIKTRQHGWNILTQHRLRIPHTHSSASLHLKCRRQHSLSSQSTGQPVQRLFIKRRRGLCLCRSRSSRRLRQRVHRSATRSPKDETRDSHPPSTTRPKHHRPTRPSPPDTHAQSRPPTHALFSPCSILPQTS